MFKIFGLAVLITAITILCVSVASYTILWVEDSIKYHKERVGLK